MIASARMHASSSAYSAGLQMNGAIAIAAIDVELAILRFLQQSLQRGGRGKKEIRGPLAEARSGQRLAPIGVELVGDDQVDAAFFQRAGGGADYGGRVRGRRQTIDDGAHANAAELLVIF